jgi:hypothetical protein
MTLLQAIADLSGLHFGKDTEKQLREIISYEGGCGSIRCQECVFNPHYSVCVSNMFDNNRTLRYARILMRRYTR